MLCLWSIFGLFFTFGLVTVVTVLAGLNGLDGLGLCPGLGRWRHLRGRRVGRQGVTKELFHLGILIVVPGLCCRLRLGLWLCLRLRLGFGLLCFGLRNRNLQLPLGPSREKGLREFLPTGTAIGREPWTPVVHNFRFFNFLELRFWCRDRRDPSILGCLGWRFGCFGCSTFARLRLGSAGRSGTGSLGSLGSGRSPGRGSLPRWNQWGIVIVVRVADFRI
mmetsp:Transcript_35307/g.76322  ORF Transcript_35307/g.76322 Transcript_35307/m.76322 type:complete len:220 (+) Transcript_35307:959-1618(+)